MDVDADTAVGVTPYDYAEGVKAISRAYARMDADELSDSATALLTAGFQGTTCLTAAATVEGAVNAHLRAERTWSDCLDDPSVADCTTGPTDDRVQREWPGPAHC